MQQGRLHCWSTLATASLVLVLAQCVAAPLATAQTDPAAAPAALPAAVPVVAPANPAVPAAVLPAMPATPADAARAQADADDSYDINVWGQARFGTDGRIEAFDVPDADSYPPALVQQLKARLAQARIPPVMDGDGQAATFETGVVMNVTVMPGGPAAGGGSQPQARVSGIAMGPRPIRRYAASHPAGVPHDNVLRVAMVCTIDVEGQCREPRIDGPTFQLASFRRWAVESLRGWRFEPQRIGGKPVESEIRQVLQLESRKMSPDHFRSPYQTFDRALRR